MRLFFNPSFKKNKNIDNFSNNVIIRRLFIISFFMTSIGLAVFTKIIEVAVVDDNKNGSTLYEITKEDNILRGIIKDRNGRILASNIFKYKLKAYPKLINNPVITAKLVKKEIHSLDEKRIIKQISNKSKYETIIARNITAQQAKYINSLGIPGLEFFPSLKRFYPHNGLLSHIVGHTNNNLRGVNGIEKTFDKRLSVGEDINLSIDIRIQHASKEELIKDFLYYEAKSATLIIADISKNEILSMVSLPDFNPNLSINPKVKSYRNTATLNLYEMGSTFKVFSIAAALEHTGIDLKSNFDASKPLQISRYTIRDYHPENRVLNTKEVFLKSSNIGASRMALELGGNNLKNFYRNLGLLDYSTINLNEKAKPKYPKKWGEIETATLSYGHGISITPIHLIEAASLIFGDKKYKKVNLELQKNHKKINDKFLSLPTKDKLLHLMEENVLYGTGKNAFVKGYRIGGKTATAEKINILEGGYDKRKLVSSFLAVFPIDKPRYISLVLFDEPILKQRINSNDGATGGKTTAKTTAKVLKRIAPFLGLEEKDNINDILVKKKKGINFASF